MSGPGLPTDISSGGTVNGHKAHSDTAYGYINKLDSTILSTGSTGDVLMRNSGGTYAPDGTVTTYGSRISALEALTINAQTGTTYTLVLGDAIAKLITLSNASAITLTVPPNSSVAFPIGTTITLAQIGAGQVTVTAGVGVTVNGAPGLKLTDQWSSATLIKRLTDTWLVVGRLSA